MDRLRQSLAAIGSAAPGTLLGAGLFLGLTGGAAVFAHRTGLPALRALAVLDLWAAVIASLLVFPRGGKPLPALALGLAATALLAWLWWPQHGINTGATLSTLQLAAILFGIAAFALSFFGAYAAQLRARETSAPLSILIPLARLLATAQLAASVSLLAFVLARQNWLAPAQTGFALLTFLLVAETFLRSLFRLYQPKRLRPASPLFGESVLLPMLFGESGPLRSLGTVIRKNFGIHLADAWLVRLLRALVAPALLVALLGVWLSTAVTRVPIDSQGVLVERGAFQPAPLPPGLHLHAPWPLARLILVPTHQTRELSLGFERDLAGPVLWAEKHFEGEQNLLVGGGEELLTVNVPVVYRVRDAVAFLRHAGDPSAALGSLGYRQLLTIAGEHTAMDLMTTDRALVAEKIRTGLQRASDRLQLGLEIVFVGLQDVHPPVPVAPAFQDVVSAEEEHDTLVDNARTYAVQSVGDARVVAQQTRLRAQAEATRRLAQARGESARFAAPLATYVKYPGVMSTRLRLETLETALAGVRQLLVLPAGPTDRRNFIFGNAASLPSATLPTSTPSAQ